jgi:cytochrome c556
MYRSRCFVAAIAVVIFAVTPLCAASAQIDKELESYRSQIMAGMASNMQAIGMIVTGKVQFPDAMGNMLLADLAVAIAGPSRSLLQLFPDKMKAASGGGEGHQIMPPFQEVAARFNGEAARLVQIVPSRNQDAIAAQYKTLDEAFQALTKKTGTATTQTETTAPAATTQTETTAPAATTQTETTAPAATTQTETTAPAATTQTETTAPAATTPKVPEKPAPPTKK